MWTVDYRLKEKYTNGFLGKSCKNIQNIKRKKWSNYRKMGVTQTILERMENNMLKWYGHVLRMA
jgi:hypothetical protein